MKVECKNCKTKYNVNIPKSGTATCKKCSNKILIQYNQKIELITTYEINRLIYKLIKNAKKKIILISPYVKLQNKIKEILIKKKQEGLEII